MWKFELIIASEIMQMTWDCFCNDIVMNQADQQRWQSVRRLWLVKDCCDDQLFYSFPFLFFTPLPKESSVWNSVDAQMLPYDISDTQTENIT